MTKPKKRCLPRDKKCSGKNGKSQCEIGKYGENIHAERYAGEDDAENQRRQKSKGSGDQITAKTGSFQ